MRDLKFLRQSRFSVRSSGLWPRIWGKHGPPKHWYPQQYMASQPRRPRLRKSYSL